MMKMKKKKAIGMGMGMMGMKDTKKKPVPIPSKSNPIILLNSFPALVETSIIDQDTTILPIKTGGIISRHFDAVPQISNFSLIVNVLIYAPNADVSPMAIFDTAISSSGQEGTTRIYAKLFQHGFGKNQNAYQHAMFYLNGISPFNGTLNITLKHPMCKRRLITVEQFANLSVGIAADSVASQTSPALGTIQYTSGLTDKTSMDNELVYGSIAIGRNFDQFQEPQGYIPIQSVGSNIDPFDTTLKTFYRIVSDEDQYGITGLISDSTGGNNFVWSAATQTFRALVV